MSEIMAAIHSPDPVSAAEASALRTALINHFGVLATLRREFPAAVTPGAMQLAQEAILTFRARHGRVAIFADLTA